MAKYFSALPRRAWTAIGCAASRLPVSHRNISLDFKVKQFLRGMGAPSEIRYFNWMGSFLQEEKQELFLPDIRNALREDDPYEDLHAYVRRSGLTDDFQRLLYLSLKLYLQDDILVKVDRASMANSLEVRAPYLDYRLVEFAARLPLRYKLRGLQTKYLLKRVAASLIPRRIVHRPKKGFGIPLSRWLGCELQPLLNEYFSEDRLRKEGFFRPEYIRRLADEHKRRVRDHRKLLWTLLIFELWCERYGTP
jgi:asparagine synthase (glutamine-hydrolysing)